MTTAEATDTIITCFAYLDKGQRLAMRRHLKLVAVKLDFHYPNGYPQTVPTVPEAPVSLKGGESPILE